MRLRTVRIRQDHPLHRFFADLMERHLIRSAGINDIEAARYIAALLVDFTHVDSLYRVRNAAGKRLEEVGEMLLESNPLLGGRSFFYEREVRKHIGDYTLFIGGLFPEYLGRIAKRGFGVDAFIDYMRAGKESYSVVASFDQFEFKDVAPLFRRLSEQFELCVFGLNLAKQELESNQRAWYQGVRRAIYY
ncbi:MAG: hypothetical protein ACRD7E_04880 [Bryobacteraceae bacterium]